MRLNSAKSFFGMLSLKLGSFGLVGGFRNARWVASIPPSITANVIPSVAMSNTRSAASAFTVLRESKTVCAAVRLRLIR